ncbi:hypothetical protein HU147_17665 [Planomicrobium chinense]|uniref:hypothetical protein n=1 Tax=Planococcus chinensis TaxID=272917 RepID=UPI001CC36D60|nr:hypothetical protein [Planococcus chinensis]MBZ5203032.1 hypothetical protein [Planococcus chinensis]
MGKRIFFVMLAVCFLLFSLFFIYSFSMSHESVPSKRQVENTVSANDLQKFGPVEGAFLHTPKNYGFYNKHRLYIVEQSLGNHEEFSGWYAVIESGEALTAEDEAALQLYAKKENPLNGLEYKSKHKMRVYQNGEVTKEEWLLKAVFFPDEGRYLSFVPLADPGDPGFNLFAEGYKKFLDF